MEIDFTSIVFYVPQQEVSTDEPVQSAKPGFSWRDSEYFNHTGGKMMDNILFRGIADSLYSANMPLPPIDPSIRSRRRSRHQVKDANIRTMIAREWVRTELPKLWNSVFSYSPHPIITWLKEKWEEVDKHPARAASIRLLISDCLVDNYHND
jgi:hypothetical protein